MFEAQVAALAGRAYPICQARLSRAGSSEASWGPHVPAA
jgi:hypothetical protein